MTDKDTHYTKKAYRITVEIPLCDVRGMLYISAKMYKDNLFFRLQNVGMHFAAKAKLDGSDLKCEPVIGLLTYAVPWQGWRIKIPAHVRGNRFEMSISAMVPDSTDIELDGFFIPGAGS